MFKYLKELFLKQIYNLLIYKIIIIDKKTLINYNNFDCIGKINIKTNKGDIYFIFKSDRRKIIRDNIESALRVKTFLVELEIAKEIELKDPKIRHLAGLVIKIMLFKNINYEILCKAILDKYIKKLIEIKKV